MTRKDYVKLADAIKAAAVDAEEMTTQAIVKRAGREMLAIFKCRFVACPTCGYDTPVEDNGLIALHGDRHGDCAGTGRPCAS